MNIHAYCHILVAHYRYLLARVDIPKSCVQHVQWLFSLECETLRGRLL